VQSILILTEYRNQFLSDISYQMLSKGRRLADQRQMELAVVIAGKNTSNYTTELARWADKVLAITNDELEGSLAEPYQKIVAYLVRDRKPRIVMMGHSSFAMDMMPSLAMELKSPLVSDCIDITWQNDNLLVKRSIYNGKLNAIYSFDQSQSETIFVTGRMGEFPVEECQKEGQVEQIKIHFDEGHSHKQFVGCEKTAEGGVDITRADVLVSIGRGITEKKYLEIVEELAQALGGVVSCSRPIVDYGWLPPERQVGLSGKTVKPKLYLSLGISGAFQHVVGMKNAKLVVAINKDAQAPIFSVAHYGIVADLRHAIPALINKINELKGTPA
jgi:electron transfer flavoprotein alpha subunit